MATFAFSDIHGRRKELDDLLEFIGFTSDDTLVFLGDYVDRGPASREVIEELIGLKNTLPKVHFLKGNHEDMARGSKLHGDTAMFWLRCGGDKTLESYPHGIPEEHWDFMANLELYVETEEAIFVHASLNEHLSMQEQSEAVLIWQKLYQPLQHVSGKRIYCGHTTQQSGVPALLGDARCIDCLGWLTAIDAESDHVYQVDHAGHRRDFRLGDR